MKPKFILNNNGSYRTMELVSIGEYKTKFEVLNAYPNDPYAVGKRFFTEISTLDLLEENPESVNTNFSFIDFAKSHIDVDLIMSRHRLSTINR